MSEWKPPETAPKDGTLVIVNPRLGEPAPAFWSNLHGLWVSFKVEKARLPIKNLEHYFLYHHYPPQEIVSWQPLPKTPHDTPPIPTNRRNRIRAVADI